MKRTLVWLLALPLMAACSDYDDLGGCSNDLEFEDAISAAGRTTLRIMADDGELSVVGRPGLTQVRVFATACSSSRRTVEDIDFDLFGTGTSVELETFVPTRDNAHLDLVVEVPIDMAVVIYHAAGNIDVRDVDLVYINDDRGHVEVRNVLFDVEVVDESGDIFVYNVDGSVDIDDGDGDIDVEDVGGDLFVRFDTSGRINYRNVRGFVDLP